jgi:hypothetical protein
MDLIHATNCMLQENKNVDDLIPGPFIYYITPKGEGVVTILLYLLYGGGEGV